MTERTPGPARLALACWVGVLLVFVGNLVVGAIRDPADLRAGILPIGLAAFGVWGAAKLVGGQRGGRTIAVVVGAVLALIRMVGLLVLVLDRLAAPQAPVDVFVVAVSAAVLTLVVVGTWAMYRPEIETFLAAAPAR